MAESYNDNLHKKASGKLYQYGRELRQSSTNTEKILWDCLRNRKFEGLKFRRQHPIDKYIVDFYCHERKLVIELDGSSHDDNATAQYDIARSHDLLGLDIRVIRFKNSEVENNIEFVLAEIRKHI